MGNELVKSIMTFVVNAYDSRSQSVDRRSILDRILNNLGSTMITDMITDKNWRDLIDLK